MMRSLGITRDDSVASWTSSLATPSHLPMSPESAVKQGTARMMLLCTGNLTR
jgi:hypothetical protein